MNKVVAFPDRQNKTATTRTGLAAEVHDLLPKSARRSAMQDSDMPLGELVAKMRRDSEALTRSMDELQSAVRQLADADLAGQARNLVNQALTGEVPAAARA